MSLEDAVVGLKAYNEVDQRMSRLCHDIDQAILHPRMDTSRGQLPTVHVQEVCTLRSPPPPFGKRMSVNPQIREYYNYKA